MQPRISYQYVLPALATIAAMGTSYGAGLYHAAVDRVGGQAISASAATMLKHHDRPRLFGQQARDREQQINKPCLKGEENRASDLCAQWKAADAALSSSEAAWLFGVVGSVIGVLTLAAASAAAVYARDAAKETKRAADIAEAGAAEGVNAAKATVRAADAAAQSNLIAIKAQRISNRPIIEVTPGGPFVDDKTRDNIMNLPKAVGDKAIIPIYMWFNVKNNGNVDAIIVVRRLSSPKHPYGSDELSTFTTIRPGETFRFEQARSRDLPDMARGIPQLRPFMPKTFSLLLNDEEQRHFRANSEPVFGQIIYDDPFGVRREHGFGFYAAAYWAPHYERWGGDQYNYDKDLN